MYIHLNEKPLKKSDDAKRRETTGMVPVDSFIQVYRIYSNTSRGYY